MKACVFVDGENFRHSIVNLFPHFHQEDYLPKLANWTEFFDWIVRNVTDNTYERIRTYWYVIKSVDFYPYSFQKRFNGWIAIQDGISSRHKAIEFRRAVKSFTITFKINPIKIIVKAKHVACFPVAILIFGLSMNL